MSAPKHTPEPWALELDSGFTGGWEIIAGEDTTTRYVLASRSTWSHRADESIANGQLMAAAPDLLEACKSALERIESDIGNLTPEGAALRAALKKAGRP